MTGQDILDQAAGTTAFVHDYLHIDWDGTETQNDKATAAVHGVAGNPVTDGIGTVPLDHSVLGAPFEDQITPIGAAHAGLHRRHGADRRPDVRRRRTRSCSWPSRSRRTGRRPTRPTSSTGCRPSSARRSGTHRATHAWAGDRRPQAFPSPSPRL